MFTKLLNKPIINITVNELPTVEQLLENPSISDVETGLSMLNPSSVLLYIVTRLVSC